MFVCETHTKQWSERNWYIQYIRPQGTAQYCELDSLLKLTLYNITLLTKNKRFRNAGFKFHSPERTMNIDKKRKQTPRLRSKNCDSSLMQEPLTIDFTTKLFAFPIILEDQNNNTVAFRDVASERTDRVTGTKHSEQTVPIQASSSSTVAQHSFYRSQSKDTLAGITDDVTNSQRVSSTRSTPLTSAPDVKEHSE